MDIYKKIDQWKRTRDNIVVNGVNDYSLSFFRNFNTSSRIIDYYTPQNWPSPWEILEFTVLCKSCLTILMYYTFKLSNINGNYEILLIDDTEDCYLILIIDDNVYNYRNIKSSTSVLTDVKIIQRFSDFEIKQYK